jgi:hypothetical protein
MSGVSDKQLVPLGPWPAGIDNLNAETDVATNDDGMPIAVREGENVDLDRKGWPQLRGGYTRRHSGASIHSLWSAPLLNFGLFVQGADLMYLPSGGAPHQLRAGLAQREMSYALVNDRVAWMNGWNAGVVYLDGEVGELGVEAPAGQPQLTATADGGLAAGQYQVAITYRDSRGEESGTGRSAIITIQQGQGIALSSIPQPQGDDIAAVRVYATQADGASHELRHVRDLPLGVTSWQLDVGRPKKLLETQLLERMPAGRVVRLLNGRLFVVVDNTLIWSAALRYGLCEPDGAWIRFPSVEMLEPVGDGTEAAGLFVSIGKRVIWLGGGDPEAFVQRIADPYAVVPGTSCQVPGSLFGVAAALVVYWIAADGVACLGLPGGVVQRLRANQVVAPQASAGASLVREQGGVRQVLTALRDTAPQTLAVQDRLSGEIYRNGVRL